MSNPTPTTLRDLLNKHRFWAESIVLGTTLKIKPAKLLTTDQATQSIQEQLKALLPKKLPNKSNEFSEAFIIGRNRTVDEIEKAIEEWAK